MLYIARHGQTEYNRDEIYQGTLDSPLTVEGKEGAAKAGEYLRGKNIQRIFHSPLGRAKSTAEIISEKIDCNLLEEVQSIREMCFGLLQGNDKDEMEQIYAQFFLDRKEQKYTTLYPGGESYEDVRNRIAADVQSIIELHLDKDIVIVGHESVNRVIGGIALNTPPEKFVQWKQKNTEMVEIDIPSGTREVRSIN